MSVSKFIKAAPPNLPEGGTLYSFDFYFSLYILSILTPSLEIWDGYFFLLNISSILSVTTKPPTTFSVPKITARKPNINAT